MSRKKNRVNFFDRTIAFTAALLVFGGFAAFLWTNTQKPEDREIVQAFDADEIATIAASTVTPEQIQQQKDDILKKEQEQLKKEQQRKEAEQKKLDELKKKQAEEQKKLEETKKKQAEEEKAIALKKKQAEEEEKKRKQAEEERKKQEEEAQKAKELAEAEQKKREEAEQKQREEEAAEAAKKAREDALAAEIAAERNAELEAEKAANQQALAEQSARASTTLLNRYAALIKEKLQSNFDIPIGSAPQQIPVVNIKLDSSGNVLSSRIVTSSGDFSYDQAVLTAVGKSSPLPLPQEDPVVRQELQDISLKANF